MTSSGCGPIRSCITSGSNSCSRKCLSSRKRHSNGRPVSGSDSSSLSITPPSVPTWQSLILTTALPGCSFPCGRLDRALDEPAKSEIFAASPLDRMVELCREWDAIGLVTNGRQWTLVYTPRDESPTFASWYSHLWIEEPLTLRSFRALLGVRRFFAAAEDETLERMLEASGGLQEEITTQLGAQVRRAVEVLVQALDRADVDSGRDLLEDLPEDRIYEAAVTVMMRLVFMFSAEERGLLLDDDPTYEQHYALSPLGESLRADADRLGVEVLERRFDAWTRLGVTFRAVFGGVSHDRMRLIAHGGSLFDPDRYPLLEGRPDDTSWRDTEAVPLPIDNRTVLHLLEALQLLKERGRESRRISFRGLDVEQIGHIYEGLLDHRALRVEEPYLGLEGRTFQEPELPLSELEALAADPEALTASLVRETGRSKSALAGRLSAEVDPDAGGQLLVACGNDRELFERVRPFAGLLRDDVWGYPLVYPAGTLLVTAGTDRRSSQTFYTPRAMAEEIVQYALEQIVYRGPSEGQPRADWELLGARELLDLKVCDPTMGSGAFLVAACRWLAERLAEAWAAADNGAVTTLGEPSTGASGELLVPVDQAERVALARLLVAENCLYGVDVNPFAVEMAKLSIWLITLARDRPFGFLDHALKSGDSLLGVTSLDQVRYVHLDPEVGRSENKTLWFDYERDVAPLIGRAATSRSELESFTVLDAVDSERKARLHRSAQAAAASVRALGDLAVACTFGDTAARGTHQSILQRLTGSDADEFQVDSEQLQILLNLDLPADRSDRRPFHWALEFPEIFDRARPGFDAIVANPPFLGGQRITRSLGTAYREYLVERLADSQRGSADLSAYFLTRFMEITRTDGTVGSLATNSIGQGVTRDVGLSRLLADGASMFRAVASRPWPGSASLEVAQVWMRKGAWSGECSLNGQAVQGIDESLGVLGRVSGDPRRLAENGHRAFQGSIVVGAGFVIEPAEAVDLISRSRLNGEVIFPYLNGRDLSSRPDQSAGRWVIYFADWPESRAREYPDVFEIVESRVKPDRRSNPRKAQRERWWIFERPRVNLYSSVADMDRVLVKAQVSSTWAWVYVPNGQVFDAMLIVFAVDDWGEYGCLQSFVHREWMWRYSTTLETRDRYTPSNLFETFPFPEDVSGIRTAGEEFHQYRAKLCLERDLGLTVLANLVDDPENHDDWIDELRRLQVALDRAVVTAYGWTDFRLEHGFREVRGKVRFALDETLAMELVDRLLELNHERHRIEDGGSANPLHGLSDSDDSVAGLPLFERSSRGD